MLGENIRKYRCELKLSQIELAKALGVSKQSVSNWENNNILPSLEMVTSLARLFSVSLDALVGQAEDREYLDVSGLSGESVGVLKQLIAQLKKHQ